MEIRVIFDYCHQVKCIRNLWLKHELYAYDSQNKRYRYIKLQTLIDCINYEKHVKGSKIFDHLTEANYEDAKVPRMKVKYATDLFSTKTVEALKQILKRAYEGEVPTAKGTSTYLN